MDIDTYLWQARRTQESLAEEVGITPASILKYKQRRITPNLYTALKLVAASNGQIDLQKLLKQEEEEHLLKIKETKEEKSLAM